MTTWFSNVVIDAEGPATLGRFWSAALGWPIGYEDADEVALDSPRGFPPALVFVPVPEPKSAQNRVHLDLASGSVSEQAEIVERLLGLGARRVDVGQRDVPWVVLADPEGNELCVLEPRERYQGTGEIAAVVLATERPRELAPFWSAALGWPVVHDEPRVVSLRNPDGTGPFVELLEARRPREGKLRLHLDVAPRAGEDQAAEVARLVARGATTADVGQGDDVTWVVLRDPEGNELCVLSPRDRE